MKKLLSLLLAVVTLLSIAVVFAGCGESDGTVGMASRMCHKHPFLKTVRIRIRTLQGGFNWDLWGCYKST